jgi:hypothetical protein
MGGERSKEGIIRQRLNAPASSRVCMHFAASSQACVEADWALEFSTHGSWYAHALPSWQGRFSSDTGTFTFLPSNLPISNQLSTFMASDAAGHKVLGISGINRLYLLCFIFHLSQGRYYSDIQQTHQAS